MSIQQLFFRQFANPPPTVEYLDIAGGGGGGGNAGGSSGGAGGGAGGYRPNTGYAVTPGSPITVTIGAGGAGGIGSSSTAATAGSNSVFGTITSTGGGQGAS